MVVEESGNATELQGDNEAVQCLVVESENKFGRPSAAPPVGESTETLRHHCKTLNINVYDSCAIEECQLVGSGTDCYPARQCVTLNVLTCMIDFLSVIKHMSKHFHSASVFDNILAISLTPRHLLSLIRYRSMACCCLARPWCLMFWFILFGALIGLCDGTLITTKQTLPSECLSWFTHEDCPVKADWDPSWNNRWGALNQKCCSGFPGTVLHCQKNGASNFPACLPEQNVTRGHTGMLVTDKEGKPQFRIVPCDSHTFEAHDRVSSNVTFPHCTGVKSSSMEGEELLCRTGTASDDLFTCSAGYKVMGDDCHSAFNHQGECWCEPLACPEGKVAMRTPIQMDAICAEGMKDGFAVEFWCNDSSSLSVPSSGGSYNHQNTTFLPGIVESTSVSTIQPVHYPTDGSTESHGDDEVTYNVLRGFMILFLVAYLVGLFGLVWIAKKEDDSFPACGLRA